VATGGSVARVSALLVKGEGKRENGVQGKRDKGKGRMATKKEGVRQNERRRRGGFVAVVCLAVCLVASPLSLFSLFPFPFSLDVVAKVAAQSPAPPTLTAPVNDFANVIDDPSKRELDRRIRVLQRATGDVVVVATVPTFAPYADINEFAVKMFENGGRGIGQKGKDNGALIVLALKERAVRIEVGYDLEEFITDGFAGATIREVMAPEFRNGAYGRGLLAGATRVINRIAERRGVELSDVPRDQREVRQPQSDRAPTFFSVLKFVVIAWIIIAILSSRRPRHRRFWGGGPWSGWNSGVGPFGGGYGGFGGGFGGFGGGGGGGGGGFGGFGGGRSGGGGASGSW
jgi:uncharacterized protein